jgi:serine/threonine protein kinase
MAVMKKIGRYRISRRIGAGSFATVWLGHDDDLDVPVAVKILADNWVGNEDVRQRFLAEARIMRRIRDERIVRVYDIGTLPDGRPYFVMDYVNGGTLDDLRKQGIEPERALRLCSEAARALHVLHENGVLHRDVTPANILLSTTDGGRVQVLIADLGVAKSLIDAAGATMTAGTPSYMAMEQATGLGTLDRSADIYALTAVTYAMLTGKPPYPVKSLTDLLCRDPKWQPEPIAARLGAPQSLDAVMVSGLAYHPTHRPPTALLLAEALETIADQLHSTETAVSPVPVASPAEPRYAPQSYFPPTPLTAPQPLAAARPMSFYVLIAVAALALFAVSLLVTISVLR